MFCLHGTVGNYNCTFAHLSFLLYLIKIQILYLMQGFFFWVEQKWDLRNCENRRPIPDSIEQDLVHFWVKHGVHITHINAFFFGSQWPQYNESSIGATFTILNCYLQVISSLSLSLSH